VNLVRAAFVAAICFILLIGGTPVAAGESAEKVFPAIRINVAARKLELYVDGQVVKKYRVAVGKPSTPTPLGDFFITYKEVNPWWFPLGKSPVPSGPDNPLGYRWMEFAPMYGIHGTNAPWSIGSAVSNGCVRMREEDAEELFALVPLRTPVIITYDRAEVVTGQDGSMSLSVFPDIYERGGALPEARAIAAHLSAIGLPGILGENEILSLLNKNEEITVRLARQVNVKINGRLQAERAILRDEKLEIPLELLRQKIRLPLIFDAAARTVRAVGPAVPAEIRGGKAYVKAEFLPRLLGGEQVFKDAENCYEIVLFVVSVNSRPVTTDVVMIGNLPAIAVAPVAEALGQKIDQWESRSGTLWINGRKAIAFTVAGKPYISIAGIYDLFQAYVCWDEEEHTIEVTYPAPQDQ